MTPRVVAFYGYAGSGKSSCARVLQEDGYRHVPFADALKSMLLVLGLTHDQVWGDQKETPYDLLCGKTPRHAMQTLGTEWGRDLIGEDLWINAWKRSVEDYQHVVVDDLRFPNEYELLRRMDAHIVRVVRRSVIPIVGHVSEAHVESMRPDFTIQNDGTLEELEHTVRYRYAERWK